MARPCRQRRIMRFPDHWLFSAEDSEKKDDDNIMTLDEYEAVRLIDYEGLTQEQCAEYMNVGRTTVTAIYDSARRKLASLIVDGNRLRISGGVYVVASGKNSVMEKKGEETMRIAVTYEDGQVFQHFGHTRTFKLYDVNEGKIVGEQIIESDGPGHGYLAGVLKEAQADLLICGGIGMGARNALAEAGIELFAGVSGNADAAVRAYLNGELQGDSDGFCSHHDHQHDHECHHGDGECHHGHDEEGCHCH